jgi:hypothetical protein
MKKLITLLALLLFIATSTKATHIVGGEINVKWVSGNNFQVTMHFYRDCSSGSADFDASIQIGIYDKVTNANQQCVTIALGTRQTLTLGDTCYKPNVCVELGTYQATVTIPNNPNGYYLTWSRCCRNSIITNIQNPGAAGETW